jgi:hypothetical protein
MMRHKNILILLTCALLGWAACTPKEDAQKQEPANDGPLHEIKVFTEKQYEKSGDLEEECNIGSCPLFLIWASNKTYFYGFQFGSGLCENPITKLELVAPHRFRATCFQKHMEVDYHKPADVEAFINFNRSLPGFTRFYRKFQRTFRGELCHTTTTCTLQLEYPDSTTAHAAEISEWVTHIVKSQREQMTWWCDRVLFEGYMGSPTDTVALANSLVQVYFAVTDSLYANESYMLDLRAYTSNERYVTYQMYTYTYGGGAHGAYSERLTSLDLNTGQPITPEYLFREDCLDKVRFVLMMTVADDAHFREWNTVSRLDDVIRRFIWDSDEFWGVDEEDSDTEEVAEEDSLEVDSLELAEEDIDSDSEELAEGDSEELDENNSEELADAEDDLDELAEADSEELAEVDSEEEEDEEPRRPRHKLPGKQLGTIDISRIGLTPEGIVISYNPYDVDCFAAGCFHFFIPYWKIHAYLSEEGRALVDGY